jgi:uncharacterized protein
VHIFSSATLGDDDETSDLDVVVKIEKGRSLLDLGELLMDLRVLLGCKVDVISEPKVMHPHFWESFLKKDAVAA